MRVTRRGVLVAALYLTAVWPSEDATAQEVTTIVTIAGRIAGFDGLGRELHPVGNDDGLGLLEASFRAPLGIDVDDDENVVVCDTLPPAGVNPFPGAVRIVSPLLSHPPADVATEGTLLYTVGPSALLPLLSPPPSVALAGAIGITDIAVTRIATPATGAAGNWVIAARGNNQVRVYTPAGVLVSAIGSGAIGLTDGAPATAAFNYPTAVAVDGAGNVLVADQTNHVIRRIDAQTGTVTTVAGQASPRQFTGLACAPSCALALGGGFADGDATTAATFRCPSG
ncbi:MAG: hypothetical protein ACREQ9_27005, partial [Candidatus Binatia bacterium]